MGSVSWIRHFEPGTARSGKAPVPAREVENIMPAMAILTYALCELRFTSRPLLELHIREDHERPRRMRTPRDYRRKAVNPGAGSRPRGR